MPDRGQTITLEAVLASLVLLATVAFALQAVAISANTATVAEPGAHNQHAGTLDGILAHAAASGDLQTLVVYWDETNQSFHGVESGGYVSPGPNSTFAETSVGSALLGAFADRQVRYTINLAYVSNTGEREQYSLVQGGTPSDNAVSSAATVTLYDDTTLVDRNESARSGVTLDSIEENFYAPNVDEDRPVYNVVRVEVVLWET